MAARDRPGLDPVSPRSMPSATPNLLREMELNGKTVIVRHERRDWSDWYVENLRDLFPDHDFHAAHTEEEALALAPRAQVIIGIGPQMSPRLIATMPQLEWIQSLTTGVDNLLAMEEMPRGVPITNCAGVQGPQMAELALLLMMSLARRFPAMLENQKRAHWERRAQPLLFGKTLCLFGLGRIAETLARYAATMGMRVTGISQRRTGAEFVDRIYPRANLLEAAATADFLVVLVPLMPETRNIVGSDVFAAMRPTAYLVNLARGGCVDEGALLDALRSGSIAGAGLDVFETEPLPAEHPLWQAPNAILTPHVGGFADIYHQQCFPTVVEHFTAYAGGGPEALKNTVSR